MNVTAETVIVISGASSGIGRALALALARKGARLGLLARRIDRLNDVANECRDAGGSAVAIECDVTKRESFASSIDTIAQHFGAIDVLVNNAGRGHHAYVEDTPDEQIENIFRVNVFSLWYGSTAAIPHMRARGGGLIVNISSLAGKVGYPANAAYVAAKHAVIGFSRALRAELAETGIDVMTVIPAGVATDWADVVEGGSMLDLFTYERERGEAIARERDVEMPASPRLLNADEVAAMIVDAIEHPQPEVYTHPGSREMALAAECDAAAFEQSQVPNWLANREGYLKSKQKR
ncbi:MAG: SDR family NAD(P)-dependent oxidoreductase [bacterium]|nr:SDR family NAD(P)-dependent oxidoreductase [Candidatus Kapabacteria bacterium]